MKSIRQLMKPIDYLMMGLAILFSFMPLILTNYFYSASDQSHAMARVKIKGEVVAEYILSPETHHIEETFHPTNDQYNIIEVQGNKIRIKEDNSPDQIGVKTGWISRPGQVAVCLPHHLLIEIQGVTDEDDLILAFPR